MSLKDLNMFKNFISTRKNKIIDRIFSRCVEDENGCMVWQGGTSGKIKKGVGGRGYGRIRIQGKTSATHRVIYTCFHGYIPSCLDIDHICNNKLCCNPNHLEAVSHKENCKRRSIRNLESSDASN